MNRNTTFFHVLAMALLLFVGVAGWHIGARLSADAIGMATGMLFGILAGIPAALMVMASQQQRQPQQQYPPYEHPYQRYQPQRPIYIAPPRPQSRGERIEQSFNGARFRCQLTKEIHFDGDKSLYEFTFEIGTKISDVEQYVHRVLASGSQSDFRVVRNGGTIQIYEQAQQMQHQKQIEVN